jgi:hypothetical protein
MLLHAMLPVTRPKAKKLFKELFHFIETVSIHHTCHFLLNPWISHKRAFAQHIQSIDETSFVCLLSQFLFLVSTHPCAADKSVLPNDLFLFLVLPVIADMLKYSQHVLRE